MFQFMLQDLLACLVAKWRVILRAVWPVWAALVLLAFFSFSAFGSPQVLVLVVFVIGPFLAMSVIPYQVHRIVLLPTDQRRLPSFTTSVPASLMIGLIHISLVVTLLMFGLVLWACLGPACIGLSNNVALLLSGVFLLVCLPYCFRLALAAVGRSLEEKLDGKEILQVTKGLGWPMVFVSMTLAVAVCFAQVPVLFVAMILGGVTRSGLFQIAGLLVFPVMVVSCLSCLQATVYWRAKQRWFANLAPEDEASSQAREAP